MSPERTSKNQGFFCYFQAFQDLRPRLGTIFFFFFVKKQKFKKSSYKHHYSTQINLYIKDGNDILIQPRCFIIATYPEHVVVSSFHVKADRAWRALQHVTTKETITTNPKHHIYYTHFTFSALDPTECAAVEKDTDLSQVIPGMKKREGQSEG